MPLLYALFFLVLAEALPAEYKLLHGPDPKDPMAAHIYQLDNGLTVYLTQNSEEPRFYAEIAVRAGSKHDPQDATGIAHYLEHMLFKGSQKNRHPRLRKGAGPPRPHRGALRAALQRD